MNARPPKHPCRPGYSRRDKVSAAVIALCLALALDHAFRAGAQPRTPDVLPGCAPALAEPSKPPNVLEL